MQELKDLSQYMTPVDLTANDLLRFDDESHHGLFFIEYGQLRIEHSSNHTTNASQQLTFARSQYPTSPIGNPLSNVSIGHLNARSGTLGRQAALIKKTMGEHNEFTEQSFRLARIGPGWVVGMIEECTGMRRAGVYVAGECIRLLWCRCCYVLS
jgi:hypothetical protein